MPLFATLACVRASPVVPYLVAAGGDFNYLGYVSATEIINNLPMLTEEDRRAIRRKLVELAAENQDIAASDQAALEGALLLDKMEDEDAAHQSR